MAGGIMNTANFSQLYDKSFRKVFFDAYSIIPEEWSKVAKVENAEGNYIKEGQLSGLGRLREKFEGGGVQYEAFKQGNSKTVYFTVWALAVAITEEMQEDDMVGPMKKIFEHLGKSAAYTRELVFWDVLNDGFAGATYTGLDSAALYTTTHALVDPDVLSGVTTVANLGTAGALSKTTIQALYDLAHAMKNEKAIPIVSMPSLLVIPPGLEWKAKELQLSELDPENAENAVNTVKGKFKYMLSHYLTSTTGYHLLDPANHDLRFIWRRKLQMKKTDDFATGDILYKVSMRCAATFFDYRGAYGNAGA